MSAQPVGPRPTTTTTTISADTSSPDAGALPPIPPPTSYTWLFVVLVIGTLATTGALIFKRFVRPFVAAGAGGGLVAILIVAAIVAVPDKAQPAYSQCQVADSMGQVAAAVHACQAAIAADPNSTSGKAAAQKLADMKPKYDAWRRDKEAKAAAADEEQRRANVERTTAAAEARKQAAAAARSKVEKRYDGTDRDGECIDKGLPAYRWHYEGGSRDEIDLVASDDGCRHLIPGSPTFSVFAVFCCPQRPGGGLF
jgi:hypothetical protein